jgi:hypothetical protein
MAAQLPQPPALIAPVQAPPNMRAFIEPAEAPPRQQMLEFGWSETVSDQHLADLEAIGIRPRFAGPLSRKPHPWARITRYAAEVTLYGYIRNDYPDATIIDVGANAQRARMAQLAAGISPVDYRYHALTPHVVRADSFRHHQARGAADSCCTHTLQTCDCTLGDDWRPPIFVFIHSLYYVQPAELLEQMARVGSRTAYAVVHRYQEMAGSVCAGEVKYTTDEQGFFVTRANGNEEVYRHPALDWLALNGINANVGDQPVHLSWRLRTSISDHEVWEFTLSEGLGPEGYGEISVNFASGVTKFEGNGESTSFAAAFNAVTHKVGLSAVAAGVTSARFLPFRIVLELRSGDLVVMPRELPYAIASTLTGLSRDPDAYQTALAAARRLTEHLNLEPRVRNRAIIYAAVGALCLSVEEETLALGLATRDHAGLWQQHAASLAFRPLRTLSREDLLDALYVTAALIPPAYTLGAFGAMGYCAHAAVALAFLHPAAIMTAATLAAVAATRAWRQSAAHTTREHNYTQLARMSVAGGVHAKLELSAPVGRPGVLRPKPTPRPLRGSVWTSGPPTRSQLQPNHGRVRTALVGIGFSNHAVVAVPNDADTTVAGLTNRLLVTPSVVASREAWADITAKLTDVDSIMSKWVYPPVPAWSQRDRAEYLASRSPEQRKAFVEAEISLRTTAINRTDLKIKTFAKLEKSAELWGSAESLKPFDPRAIQSLSPRANAVTAPFHYMHDKVWLNNFTKQDLFHITVGDSAEDVGEWYDAIYDHFSELAAATGDEVVFVEGDMERQDLHTQPPALESENEMYRLNGASADVLYVHAGASHARGHIQKSNYKFSLNPGEAARITGGRNTIKGNTYTNMANTVHRFGEPGWNKYGGIFIGDDNLLVGLKSKLVDSKSEALGFRCTISIQTQISQVRYCQMRFYPSKDGTMPAPCIGRTLAHFGYSTSAVPDVYGASCGLIASCAHVPFLREWLEAHRRLSASDKQARRAERDYHVRARVPHAVSPAIWDFLQQAYGLNQGNLPGFVDQLNAVQTLPAVISWGPFEQLHAIDFA